MACAVGTYQAYLAVAASLVLLCLILRALEPDCGGKALLLEALRDLAFLVLGLALYFSFNDQLGAFVDSYNYLNSEEGNQYMIETGLYWQVSRRVQLDIEGDFDVQNFGKYYAVGCGVSWMIN